MRRNAYVVAAIATTIGLVAACGNSSNSSTSGTSTTSAAASSSTSSSSQSTTTTSSATATATTGSGSSDLVPTPANNQRTDGPDPIHDSGTHTHFLVNGSPADVMTAYKTALEGKGWSVSGQTSSGGYGGGGATYTGKNGDAFGVFTGGGYGGTTDVNACVWPSQPANTDCGRS